MSKPTYDRALAREAKIWENPQVDDLTAAGRRFVVKPIEIEEFLLERNRLSQDNMVEGDAETEAINKLDIMLGIALTGMAADHVNFLAKLASKRVVMSYEYKLKQQKLNTKAYANTVADELMTSKIAALAVDYAEIETLQLKVNIYIQETELKVKELQAKISEQALLLVEAEVDVLRAQIDVAKAQNAIAKEALNLLSVQIAILDVAFQIAETVLKKVELDAQLIGISSAIKRTTIAGYRLQSAQTRLAAETYSIAQKLIADLGALIVKGDTITTDIQWAQSYYNALLSYMTIENAVEQVKQTVAGIYNSIDTDKAQNRSSVAANKVQLQQQLTVVDTKKVSDIAGDEVSLIQDARQALIDELTVAYEVAKIKTAEGFAIAFQHALYYGGMSAPSDPTVPPIASGP